MQARPERGGASDRIADPWGPGTPYGPGADWPVRVDTFLDGVGPEQVDRWVRSACVLCSNGCGLDIAVAGGRMVGVRGRAGDRVNHGRLGPKGLFGWQANHAADRLTRPLVRDGGELVETDWDTAMDRIVRRSRHQLDTLGPGSIGFYTSGQLFAEEYYTLAVIGKAGLGTPHMDGNTRLCTATAAQALKETFGTDGQPASYNLALLNGLLRELIEHGWVDRAFIDAHTVGFDQLAAAVKSYDPERVASICGVPADQVREAARILGTGRRLLSTVLQGVYQSMSATAAACQVNNLNLVRGMIGRPGCGVLQMNGQPTAQNTRETGADGDLPGFRNWDNEAHVRELAELWNVDPIVISATNPAVSLPELGRIRSILASDELFVVVQDAFLTETARYADVVLPTALWGEKTGTFTNTDRTVHLSEQAVDPPGEARSDLDVFCDYTGLTYRRLRDAGGLQWPCDDQHPDGTERLYTDLASTPTPTTARTTGTTCSPGRSPPRPSTGPPTRPGGRSSRPPTTSRRTSCRPRTSRCC
jgi:anaerobic selenocysteine-containing dehydrogenase